MGLAETYSTFTFTPAPSPECPNARPASIASVTTSYQTSGESLRFRNPGPATSAAVTRGSASSRSASCPAISRGCIPAGLASTIAAFVAMSPWSASRGGSTATAP